MAVRKKAVVAAATAAGSLNEAAEMALVVFIAADQTKTNAWKLLCDLVSKFSTDIPSLKEVLKNAEENVKKKHGIDTLPTAWRSAKSTALTALKAGVSFVGTDGTLLGKSEVYKEVKLQQTSPAPTPTEVPCKLSDKDKDVVRVVMEYISLSGRCDDIKGVVNELQNRVSRMGASSS